MAPYYADDHVTLYHGDCLELIGRLAFDVVVTDPPYGTQRGDGTHRGGYGRRQNHQHNFGASGFTIANDDSTETRDAALAMCPDVPICVFGSPRDNRTHPSPSSIDLCGTSCDQA